MVLAELGGKLRDSLRKLHSASGHVTEKQLNQLLSEIARALIESDVNVKMVMELRENVKTKVQGILEEDEGDATEDRPSNVSKTVQRAVVDELVNLLSPSKKPYTMKRGKPNVVLFVGLQGAGKTTSIAKFANYYNKKGFKTAMVCAVSLFPTSSTACVERNGMAPTNSVSPLSIASFINRIPSEQVLLISSSKMLPNCESPFMEVIHKPIPLRLPKMV
jgi:hypothetical protein